MVRFTEPLGEQYGVRAICGKGGFPDEAIEPMPRLGMVYFAIVGGAAALETTQIEEIEEVAWEELMPECLWRFRVKDFGPLTVGIDAHGNSLYHDVQTAAKREAEGDLCPALDGFLDSGASGQPRPNPRPRQGARPCADGRTFFEIAASYVDIVKLGWGTAYVTNNLERSSHVSVVREAGRIGGTFFEVVYAQRPARRVQVVAERARLTHVEISDGTVDIPRDAQARADRRLRPRLHRSLRGRLEGLRRRVLRAVPVGRVDQAKSSTPVPGR